MFICIACDQESPDVYSLKPIAQRLELELVGVICPEQEQLCKACIERIIRESFEDNLPFGCHEVEWCYRCGGFVNSYRGSITHYICDQCDRPFCSECNVSTHTTDCEYLCLDCYTDMNGTLSKAHQSKDMKT